MVTARAVPLADASGVSILFVPQMEFACSHVVCDWRPDGAESTGVPLVEQQYDNSVTVKPQEGPAPPPLPPRRLRKPRPLSLPLPPLPPTLPPAPSSRPPVPSSRPPSAPPVAPPVPSSLPPVPSSRPPVPSSRPPSAPPVAPPVPSSLPPVPSSRPPVPSSRPPSAPPVAPPVPSSLPPVPSSRPPVSSSRPLSAPPVAPPVPSSLPPVPSSRPPVSSSRPPVSSSRPPVSSSRPPVSSSRPPGAPPVAPPVPPRGEFPSGRLVTRVPKCPLGICFPPLLTAPVPRVRSGRRRGGVANVNVVSANIGELVDLERASGPRSSQSPVVCGKCGAALSHLSSIQSSVWGCEFCGFDNAVPDGAKGACGDLGDDLYLSNQSDDDYQNLEDTLLVFCVDISGSMSVTAELPSSGGSPVHVSRLEGMQDALQGALSSVLQLSPHRRVALVTFNDEVVIYGDGTGAPLSLRDWALVDYDHIWQQGVAYSIPHCIAETYQQLAQRVKDLREHGATSLGPAALVSVAMASRYPGSKVILCTDGKANIGLGEMEPSPSPSSSPTASYFYTRLGLQAVGSGVIISVMTFEGTDCRLADVGRLSDATGGKVNIVSIGTVATEIRSACVDNILATGVTATMFAPDGVYFPYKDDSNHKLVKAIGNVTRGLEVTIQFAVKPEFREVFLQRETLPFQLQLLFTTRDREKVTRVLTERRPVATCSSIPAGSLNVAVLGVHCAQLCASLTRGGGVQEAQRHLKAQQTCTNRSVNRGPLKRKRTSMGTGWTP
uniref:VWFA domain-containing protein n=1 Tax=Gasterosteus aculeatus aculeatus TaxID=481459 RepID=A0AAQ4PQX5_GASAC|nr:circularly permutated Ras protein 1 isoform X1 [Gasterosteus aculeatus aculeatus]